MLIGFSLAWAVLITFLIVRAVKQYGAYKIISPENIPRTSPRQHVAIIVPARNEQRNIHRCVQSLVQQDFPADQLRIVVIDDNSTDETPKIVQELAAKTNRLKYIEGRPLPQGWKGKPYACAQGAQLARSLWENPGAAWLCFMDADTWAGPELIRCAVSAAADRGLDMLSLEPVQVLGTFWERLVIPAGLFMMAFGHDLRKVNDPGRAEAVANGQFILIRRSVYEKIGGHVAVKDEFSEDSALARLVKQSGNRLAVLGTKDLLWARMYQGLASLWEGVSKNVLDMVGGSRPMLGFSAAGILLAFATVAMPIWGWLAVAQDHSVTVLCAAIVASCASAAIMGMHIGGACYFKIPWWYGALFPLGYALGAALGVNSVLLWTRGRITWKGRNYLPPTRTRPGVAKPAEPPHKGLQW